MHVLLPTCGSPGDVEPEFEFAERSPGFGVEVWGRTFAELLPNIGMPVESTGACR